jgi:NADP-dependent 3-hydroxy acid dehydrogenase YdfG
MKTAIVTGASKGVGYATVKLLSENGYRVIAVSRDLSKVFQLGSKNIEPYVMDITQPKEIERFSERYKDITLDLLVNNAGGGASPTRIIDETMDNFRTAYEINVSGPMYLSQLFVPALKKSESPTIIFVTSLSGKVPFVSGGNYTNAKRGEMALVDTMRMEFPEYGIKVTEICPGTIDTQEERKPYSLTAEDMAEAIRWVGSLPKHFNVNHLEVSNIFNNKYGGIQ